MRKSKGRKSGKAESDKRDDAQNGDPERDSNEAGEEDDDDEEEEVKPKKSPKSSKRQSRSKDQDEDEDDEEDEDADDQDEEEESEEKPSKKSKKRKSSAKKGKGKSKKSKKASDLEDKSDDEGTSSKKSKRGKKAAKEDEDSDDDDEEVSKEEYEVEKIVDVHFKKNGEKDFLVRWKGYSSKQDTWEPEEHLNCKDLISSFLKKCEEARNTTQRETRVNRKTTDRFILNSQESGRKLSRRHKGKARKTYFEDE